jgi:hypothetical protein
MNNRIRGERWDRAATGPLCSLLHAARVGQGTPRRAASGAGGVGRTKVDAGQEGHIAAFRGAI